MSRWRPVNLIALGAAIAGSGPGFPILKVSLASFSTAHPRASMVAEVFLRSYRMTGAPSFVTSYSGADRNLQQSSPRRRLYALLEKFRSGDLDTNTFCSSFEQTYNLELDQHELSLDESGVFAELFEKVVWFSPYPEDRREIPNYLAEEEIAQAVSAAILQLQARPDK